MNPTSLPELFKPSRDLTNLQKSKFLGLKIFRKIRKIFSLVPNTGEANDEMCDPTALIISEKCTLGLENNNRLRQ